MVAQAQAFGLRPTSHLMSIAPSNWKSPLSYSPLATSAALFTGDPLVLSTGVWTQGSASGLISGVFGGVQWTDSGGTPKLRPNWVANDSTLSGSFRSPVVWRDPFILYEICTDGAIGATMVGIEFNFTTGTIGTGDTGSGLSKVTLSATNLATTGVQGAVRLMELAPYPNNLWSDSFVIVRVMLANLSGIMPGTSA